MHHLFKQLGKWLKQQKLYYLTGSSRLVKHVKSTKLDFRFMRNNLIDFPALELTLDIKKDWHVLQNIKLLSILNGQCGCTFKREESGGISIAANSVKYFIRSFEDIVLLGEILIKRDYALSLPRESVIVDVGMNNGHSALYFAAKPKVVKVIGYEPFLPTYEIAKNNIKLNKELAAKIETRNYGLGEANIEMDCDYSYENTAGAGVKGILGRADNVIKERIKIKAVSKEIKNIKEIYSENCIVMKIDIEGSEFEVIESLAKQGLIADIDIFIIEWHEKSPEPIIDNMLASGFTVFCSDSFEAKAGMLYAFRIV